MEGLDHAACENIHLLTERFRSRVPNVGVDVEISVLPIQHVGLGSKTALSLGLLQAMNLATDANLDSSDLQYMSGRGGTSGIGITTFFQGGFLIDLGHANESSHRVYLPSSAHQPLKPPMVACRADIPSNWEFHLILADGFRLSGSREKRFFADSTPIPNSEVFESIASVYHGVLPAVFNADLHVLSASLRRLHEVGFKSRELKAQAKIVRDAYADLQMLDDCAVGLSSLGPLLYVVTEGGGASTVSDILRFCGKSPSISYLGKWSGRNHGHEVILV